jgi:Pyruvate/2-oxoacid:ferredoxin oxidoreductase delta subunit
VGRPRWFVALVRRAYPGRFLAARLTRVPLLGRAIERLLLEGDRLVYLPRDGVVAVGKDGVVAVGEKGAIPVGEQVDLPGSLVLPSQVVEHFIEEAGTLWIMNTCLCRESTGCQDYPIDVGCLFLGEAAAGINPHLGRPVSKAEARAHVQRARDAGLVHLVGRNKLDTVWLGVRPGQRLLTICHCCPCCCLYGILPHMAPHMAAAVTAMPGVRVHVTERCTGCGLCAEGVCFVEAIDLVDGRAEIGAGCRGCGRCVEVCPVGAIELSIEDDAYVAETIAGISALVDVGND